MSAAILTASAIGAAPQDSGFVIAFAVGGAGCLLALITGLAIPSHRRAEVALRKVAGGAETKAPAAG
ncbi:hypothetical protein ABZV67_42630 [Streptomyces sp. NPDC005065]|uniref:hypothetical protein n=1 Tax=Streptomyces sp. NPDC005065 TaxID=3154461 RepID=UPI0033BF8DEC